jgi:hypothetical protein
MPLSMLSNKPSSQQAFKEYFVGSGNEAGKRLVFSYSIASVKNEAINNFADLTPEKF